MALSRAQNSGGLLILFFFFNLFYYPGTSFSFFLQAVFFFFLIFVYLFLAVLGLCCSVGFSLVVTSGGYSLVAGHGLLIAVVSLVAEHGL